LHKKKGPPNKPCKGHWLQHCFCLHTNVLEDWTDEITWQMKFTVDKCKIMHMEKEVWHRITGSELTITIQKTQLW